MEWTWKLAIAALGIVQLLVGVIWGQLTRRLDTLEAQAKNDRDNAEEDKDQLNIRIDSERTEREQRDREILARVDHKYDLMLSKLDQLRDGQQANAIAIKSELHALDLKLTARPIPH